MREADLVYESIGDPVDGFQQYRLETPDWTSYPVVRVGQDPNVKSEEGKGEPFPLEYTVKESDGRRVIHAEWNTNTHLFDFAQDTDTYYIVTDSNLTAGSDDAVELTVSGTTDECPKPTHKKKYPRPMDSWSLVQILHDENIVLRDVSSVLIANPAGDFMWTPENRASAVVDPKSFTDLGLGVKALTDVYDATRNRETAPSVTVFQDGLRLAVADAIFDLTSQGVSATL